MDRRSFITGAVGAAVLPVVALKASVSAAAITGTAFTPIMWNYGEPRYVWYDRRTNAWQAEQSEKHLQRVINERT